MKHLAFVVLLLASITLHAQTPELQKAQTKAKAEQKRILLLFSGSDWCIPCIKMEKEVIEKEAFQTYANQNLVILKADFPRLKKNQLPKDIRDENEALASQYNKEGAFPLTLLLDAEGHVIKNWVGAVSESPEGFIQQLDATKK